MAAMRHIDLRVTGAGQRRAATATHRRADARRDVPAQPRCGCVRSCLRLRYPAARFHHCNAVEHPRVSTSTPWPAGGVRVVWLRRRSCAGLLRVFPDRAVLRAGRRLLVAEHLSRGDDVHDTRKYGNRSKSTVLHMWPVSLSLFVNVVQPSCAMGGYLVAMQHRRWPGAYAIRCAHTAS